MATAPIDVALRVRGGRELDQLIKRMDKLEKETSQTQKALKDAFSRNTLNGINRGTTSLGRFTKEAESAERAVRKLARTTKSVGSVKSTVTTSGGGSGGSAGAGITAGVASAVGARAAGSALAKEFAQVAQAAKPLEEVIEKVKENTEQLTIKTGKYKEGLQESRYAAIKSAQANSKIQSEWAKINDLTNRYKASIGNIKRIDETL